MFIISSTINFANNMPTNGTNVGPYGFRIPECRCETVDVKSKVHKLLRSICQMTCTNFPTIWRSFRQPNILVRNIFVYTHTQRLITNSTACCPSGRERIIPDRPYKFSDMLTALRRCRRPESLHPSDYRRHHRHCRHPRAFAHAPFACTELVQNKQTARTSKCATEHARAHAALVHTMHTQTYTLTLTHTSTHYRVCVRVRQHSRTNNIPVLDGVSPAQ